MSTLAEAWSRGWDERDNDCSEPYSPHKVNPYREDDVDEAQRLRDGIASLADKWAAEADEARAHGTPDPKSSKRAHIKALRRLLTTTPDQEPPA